VEYKQKTKKVEERGLPLLMLAIKVSKITIFVREERKVHGWHAFAGNHGLEVKGYGG